MTVARDAKTQTPALAVPAAAVRYILLQRPMLQRFQPTAEKLGVSVPVKVAVESLIRRGAIRRQFRELMAEEYVSLQPCLPRVATRVLDIGCGVAGIDALLFRHFGQDPNMHFFLLDRTELPRPPCYGFSNGGEFYNSLDVAKQLLCANGVAEANVHAIRAAEAGPVSLPAVDLVISLASWGFHYPVSVYLDPVWRALAPGGAVILDIRTGLGEEELVANRFDDVRPVCVLWDGKARRYCARRGPNHAGGD
jgi:SAM-dependent methyltransferase